MPVSALPGPYGIGTLGQAAYDFVDFLAEAGQRWWQMLPVGPTSYGDSPYQSFSTFAGNPYFVDLDMLIADGLLTQEEADAPYWGSLSNQVDYAAVYEARFDLLAIAYRRGWSKHLAGLHAFQEENSGWLPNYVLYMAIKRENGMHSWLEWPEPLRRRDPQAIAGAKERLAEDIRVFTFIQYLFDRQWKALREYAHEHGVYLFGDLPIYVALDSADVWSEPEQFQLDSEGFPTAVAGVPPDYFSETGQLWGNPLYRWDRMREEGYGWWIRRLDAMGRRFDQIRIDHFRGFAEYWSIPYGAETAAEGHWEPGPGLPFVQVLTGWFPHLGIVAEDLGVESPNLTLLLQESGLPGMKVLQFAFDPWDDKGASEYLPHNYERNSVVYTGTHDNDTTVGWYASLKNDEKKKVRTYLRVKDRSGVCAGMIHIAMGSVSELCVIPIQDWLELGSEARINIPSTLGGNWCWRMKEDALTDSLALRIREMTARYGRLA
jgi:4-alpha-glucanotransferase